LAHIGVLKVLERARIPIDYLAGTSMGGVIAAGYAAGLSPEFMEREALRMSRYSQLARLFDLSLPGAGLVEGKKMREYLARHLGERTFADLEIPLALMAVDLLTGQEVALTEGPVVDAVRATISLPGIFAPIRLDNRLLVDGGVLNNLPADVVRNMDAEVVIAVDVSIPLEALPEVPDGNGRHLPLTQVPLTVQTLRRTLGVMMAHMQAQKLAQARPEVLIRPELNKGITLLSGFNRAAEVIAAGERAAEVVLPRIRQMLQRRFWLSLLTPHA
jgi:NTE family protein